MTIYNTGTLGWKKSALDQWIFYDVKLNSEELS